MQSSRLYLRVLIRCTLVPLFGAVNVALGLVFGSFVIVSLFWGWCEILGAFWSCCRYDG